MSALHLPSGTTVDRDHLNLPFALGWAQQSIKSSLQDGGLPERVEVRLRDALEVLTAALDAEVGAS